MLKVTFPHQSEKMIFVRGDCEADYQEILLLNHEFRSMGYETITFQDRSLAIKYKDINEFNKLNLDLNDYLTEHHSESTPSFGR